MSHAKSLRVIGQTLQAAKVTSFKLEKHADGYRLWIAKRQFHFAPADISRLDAAAQKRRRSHRAVTRWSTSLSQQLRALGGYVDKIEVRSFRIVWAGDSAILEYERINGERKHRLFTAEELVQLGLQRSSLRSSNYVALLLDA